MSMTEENVHRVKTANNTQNKLDLNGSRHHLHQISVILGNGFGL